MRDTAMPPNATLYDEDFYTWTQAQAALLREGAYNELDLANLAEEIESLGKSDRRALRSHLEGLLMHLLKWRYQPRRRQTGHSWYSTIAEHRKQIVYIIEDSPSLRRLVPSLITGEYPGARQRASAETRLPLATFPDVCPWTAEQVINAGFWPEA